MFNISECRKSILSDKTWITSDDYALFHFTSTRAMETPHLFDDCFFYDLSINHKVSWGAPIPSTFQSFFPDLLEIIMPPDNILLLNVVDTADRGDFQCLDNDDFIKSFLDPKGYRYFFLYKEIDGHLYRTLFFECPIKDLGILDNIAYPCTFTDIDGFILEKKNLPLFAKWRQMDNNDLMFRDLIKNVYLSFGVWYDKNGLFIVSDKLSPQRMRAKLDATSLADEIRKYIEE